MLGKVGRWRLAWMAVIMYGLTGAKPMQPEPKNVLNFQINQEIKHGPYYQQNFSNDGERFVAWYLRRVLLRDAIAVRYDITDGANDKQIDAVVVDDEESRVLIIQGKFIGRSEERRVGKECR